MPDLAEAVKLLQAGQRRIESKLDLLLEALAEDGDDPQPMQTLEGQNAGRERDQNQSLG